MSPACRKLLWTVPVVVLLVLAGCATGEKFFRNGKDLIEQGNVDEGLLQLEKAVHEDPENKEFRAYLVRQRGALVNDFLGQAENARLTQQFDRAEADYRQVLKLEPNNQRAQKGIEAVQAGRRHADTVAEARTLFKAGKLEEAQARLKWVLDEDPAYQDAQALRAQIEDKVFKDKMAPSRLKPALSRPITMEFRDANLKSVFEMIARTAGINFIFDKDVRPDLKTSIFVKDTTVEDVINLLMVTNQVEKKILNDNTILIYPNTPAKNKDYQDLVVRTFYLANSDAKQVMNMIKSLVKTKDVYIDEKLNMLAMRDTPEAIRLAERLVAAQDLAEPEVLLEVEVLEIQRSKLTELGIQFPNQFTVLNIVPNPTTTTTTPGGTTIISPNFTTTTSQLTLENLRHGIKASQVGISNPALNLRGEGSDVNILANPRIRVRNKERAKIHIGDKVPVVTTTSTANVGISESVSYLDVGIKLDVEPRVFLDNEVAIKVGLEVSSIVQQVTTKSGTLTYQLGTRNAETTLRLRDGETQALAGLINDQDRQSMTKIPFLGDAPILGRLFSNQTNDRIKTEIVLLITPHIVRNLPQPQAAALEFPSGTESAVGFAPLTLKPAGTVSIPPQEIGPDFKPSVETAAPVVSNPVPVETPANPPEPPVRGVVPGEQGLPPTTSVPAPSPAQPQLTVPNH